MVFYSRKPKKKKAKVMNSFYHIENSKLSEFKNNQKGYMENARN